MKYKNEAIAHVINQLQAGYGLGQAIYSACLKFARTYEEHAALAEFLEDQDW